MLVTENVLDSVVETLSYQVLLEVVGMSAQLQRGQIGFGLESRSGQAEKSKLILKFHSSIYY